MVIIFKSGLEFDLGSKIIVPATIFNFFGAKLFEMSKNTFLDFKVLSFDDVQVIAGSIVDAKRITFNADPLYFLNKIQVENPIFINEGTFEQRYLIEDVLENNGSYKDILAIDNKPYNEF